VNTFDRRLTPARPDLAAEHLRGLVDAPRYAEGVRMVVREPAAPLRREPVPDVPLDTEALYGETMVVYEADAEGWSWGQLDADGYVGFMPTVALELEKAPATHRVCVLRSFMYPGPGIKLPPMNYLGFGSHVRIVSESGPFLVTHTGGYIHGAHLVPLDTAAPDPVAVAEQFRGVPYLWGGRSSLGLDCSALVQTALHAAGMACPRDSDMQAAELGYDIPVDGPFRRGDLIFWRGHVGIMTDTDMLLHANGHHMMVVKEPLAGVVHRIHATDTGVVTRAKRL
jgi:cell wall-associated NlpC family hydrolase